MACIVGVGPLYITAYTTAYSVKDVLHERTWTQASIHHVEVYYTTLHLSLACRGLCTYMCTLYMYMYNTVLGMVQY